MHLHTCYNPLPVTVIAELLGVPTELREDFKRWSDAIVGSDEGLAEWEVVDNELYRVRTKEATYDLGQIIYYPSRFTQQHWIDGPSDGDTHFFSFSSARFVNVMPFCHNIIDIRKVKQLESRNPTTKVGGLRNG